MEGMQIGGEGIGRDQESQGRRRVQLGSWVGAGMVLVRELRKQGLQGTTRTRMPGTHHVGHVQAFLGFPLVSGIEVHVGGPQLSSWEIRSV